MGTVSIARAHRVFAAPLVLAILTGAGGALAEAPPPATAGPSDAASAQGPGAEQLADQAFAAYEANDFATAIGLYMKSFQISGDARILYNVASIYDKKLHDRKLAEDFYRRYLKSTTTEPDVVKKANDRLTEMKNEKETLSDNADAKAPVAHAPPPAAEKSAPPAEDSSLKPVGLVVAGVGLVAVGVGSVFGVSALSKADDVKSQCPNGNCATPDGPQLFDDASSAATASTILVIGGLALLVGGAAMYLFAPSPKTTGLRVRPTIGQERTGLSFAGSF